MYVCPTNQSSWHGCGDPPVESVVRTIYHSCLMLLGKIQAWALHTELHPALSDYMWTYTYTVYMYMYIHCTILQTKKFAAVQQNNLCSS